eukprot:c17673_g1_i2 orf=162-488(-)
MNLELKGCLFAVGLNQCTSILGKLCLSSSSIKRGFLVAKLQGLFVIRFVWLKTEVKDIGDLVELIRRFRGFRRLEKYIFNEHGLSYIFIATAKQRWKLYFLCLFSLHV